MTPKSFLVLLAVTVATVAGAVGAVLQQPAAWRAAEHDQAVFPLLAERLNDLAKLEVSSPEGEIVVERREDTWVLPSEHGYAARENAVRDTVLALQQLKVAEAKTTTPEGFKRLEVEDRENADAKSRLVRLTAADGTILAEALLGKSRPGALGEASGGIYFRRPGEDQAWLAAGQIELPETERAWLQNDVVHLPADTVARLSVTYADGTRFAASRPSPETPTLSPEEVPEGREVATSKTRPLASVLAFVAFDEVMPAEDAAFAADPSRIRVTTFDGVVVDLDLGEVAGELWARVKASTAEDVAEEGRAEAEKRAAEINRRTEGWLYQLADHVVTRLLPKTGQFLEPEPEPTNEQ